MEIRVLRYFLEVAREGSVTHAARRLHISQRIFTLLTEGRSQEGIALLAQHRREILDCCHREQKKIDCLDYLVYSLKSKNISKSYQGGILNERETGLDPGVG